MKQLLLIIGTTKRLRYVVIVSISCIIFFYCNNNYYYSGSYYHLLHTYSSPITTFFFNFSSSSSVVNRNLMFLICNAILAFLAKTMRLVATVSDDNDYSMDVLKQVVESPAKHLESFNVDDLIPPTTLEKTSIMDHSQPVLEKCSLVGDEDENEEVEDQLQVEEEETGKSSLMPNLETDDQSNRGDESHVEDDVSREEDDDVEEEEEEEKNMMSTEELNRKIEEFIRKMKEDIRIQHQQSHLIAAL